MFKQFVVQLYRRLTTSQWLTIRRAKFISTQDNCNTLEGSPFRDHTIGIEVFLCQQHSNSLASITLSKWKFKKFERNGCFNRKESVVSFIFKFWCRKTSTNHIQRVSSLQSPLSGSKNRLNLARMSQTIPYSIVLTSVYSGDLGLQIIQRTSPEYPWIDSSAQWTVEACIPQFFFRGLSHV